jgi:hypothetical protein
MYVILGTQQGAPSTLLWATKDGVFSAILEAATGGPGTSPSPSGAPSGSGAPAASGRPSAGASASAPAAP